MWNNFLQKLWNRKLPLSVKWNKSFYHTPQGVFRIAKQYFTPGHFTNPQDLFRWKKHPIGMLFSGGGRWIRTTEARRNRFTVCPLWPLGNPSIYNLVCPHCDDLNSIPSFLWIVNTFFENFLFIFHRAKFCQYSFIFLLVLVSRPLHNNERTDFDARSEMR